jgi:hypothetical protein
MAIEKAPLRKIKEKRNARPLFLLAQSRTIQTLTSRVI